MTGLIGIGGFGIVYLAYDHSLGCSVALKEYMPSSLLSRFDVNDMPIEALLFQTGYLTIDHAEWTGHKYLFHLRYPNHEVCMGLIEQLLFALNPNDSRASANLYRLHQLLSANDLPGLKNLFHAFFAGIPHHGYANNPIARATMPACSTATSPPWA